MRLAVLLCNAPIIIPICHVGKLRLLKVKQFVHKQAAQLLFKPISVWLQNPGGLRDQLDCENQYLYASLLIFFVSLEELKCPRTCELDISQRPANLACGLRMRP